jgi:hypothetical protein
MLKAVFTLDYEIHGNGEGCPYALMVEPTLRMLRQFDQYGAKLTIMADIAEILKFKEYAEKHGRDDYHYAKIVAQLRDAIRRGHDVQLHIHSSYFNARHEDGRWVQDWSEYDFAGLSLERMKTIVRRGKEFLESLLQPVDPNYKCIVFRAANWSVCPSKHVVQALVANGIKIDSSVFKYGRRENLVHFDYTAAHSTTLPWKANEDNICAEDPQGRLLEFPIYSENRWLGAFLTPQRIYRLWLSNLHKLSRNGKDKPPALPATAGFKSNGGAKHRTLTPRYAWKADFNQCSGPQLVRALQRAEADYSGSGVEVPFVLIGHSKLYNRLNEWSLRPFLSFVARHSRRFGFAKFGEFDLRRFGLP